MDSEPSEKPQKKVECDIQVFYFGEISHVTAINIGLCCIPRERDQPPSPSLPHSPPLSSYTFPLFGVSAHATSFFLVIWSISMQRKTLISNPPLLSSGTVCLPSGSYRLLIHDQTYTHTHTFKKTHAHTHIPMRKHTSTRVIMQLMWVTVVVHVNTHKRHTLVHSSSKVCDREIPVFIAPCSLTPSNPFGVAQHYGQFTLFCGFSLCSLNSNPLSCCVHASDMFRKDSSYQRMMSLFSDTDMSITY